MKKNSSIKQNIIFIVTHVAVNGVAGHVHGQHVSSRSIRALSDVDISSLLSNCVVTNPFARKSTPFIVRFQSKRDEMKPIKTDQERRKQVNTRTFYLFFSFHPQRHFFLYFFRALKSISSAPLAPASVSAPVDKQYHTSWSLFIG